jgi:methylenetetrahydrofolate dehydrogenase (NADP+)/methenyltetrahydrofolate cyclohydrolase/formyltetrahydrofolate synthetase
MQWALGGEGAVDLSNAVVRACSSSEKSSFKFLYDLNLGIKEKIDIIAREMYGAEGIELSEIAQRKIDLYTAQVYIIIIHN